VSDLTFGLLSALLATNQPLAVSNLVQQQTGVALPVVNPNDPAEKDLHELMIADDNALEEVHSWIQTNQIPHSDTNAIAQFNRKIRDRLDDVKHSYDNYLHRYPDSARGYLAYGSFLDDIGDEDGAMVQYSNSKQLDPKNPAVWNQIANYEGEHGELTNAFTDYSEAIRLDPSEPVYYRNFATTVYLYRKDAREFYHITEPQVFDKALELYRQAMKLNPDDLVIATDYAESYYGIKPLRTNDALMAWTNAYNICKDENEREGVLLHLARVKIAAGFYDEAQAQLDAVTNADFFVLRTRLERSLADHKNPPTNDVVEVSTNNPTGTNIPAVSTNEVPAVTNLPPVSPKVIDLSTNLDVAAPVLREQKP
jgi:tetratricopeptide (TPR) repeat protein